MLKLCIENTNQYKLCIENTNPYDLKKHGLEDLFDTSNFSKNTIFPLVPGMNEKCLGLLKFENGGCPCKEFNARAPKTSEEKRINQVTNTKAKGLKKGYENKISKDDFKNVAFYEKPLRISKKIIIISKNFQMIMEDVEKDVITIQSNKRESFSGLSFAFQWGI